MPLIRCPECENEISDKVDTVCPKCGFKLDEKSMLENSQKNWGQGRWFFVGILGYFGTLFILLMIGLASIKLAALISVIVGSVGFFAIKNHKYLGKFNKYFFNTIVVTTVLFVILTSIMGK